MSKEMFTNADSVDNSTASPYTAHELRRIANSLEKILQMMETGTLACNVGKANLDNGISGQTTPASVSEALTVSEAAKMLRISMPKMYELVHDGKVHSLSIGRKILVSRSSLIGLLQEGE